MKELRVEDIQPIHLDRQIQSLSRPSLSYWEDAWRRLKKNKQALVSLYLIILILLFVFVGPLLWRVDPSVQDVNQISVGPHFGKKSLVVDLHDTFQPEQIQLSPPAFPVSADQLEAPANIELIGQPNSQFVRLKWTPVSGAHEYAIYRSEVKPQGQNIGFPLATIPASQISYEDQLKLKEADFYYTVLAKDASGNEATNLKSIEAKVIQALPIEQARETNPDVKVGDFVDLKAHPLGTDYLGRDMLARLMKGGQISLFIGLVAPFIFLLFGAFYGGFSGFMGGRLDNYMMRFADFIVGLPFLLFMILFRIAAGIGPGESGIMAMMAAMVLLSWPGEARLVRGQVLQLREEGFIQASKLLGARPVYLILRHMLPNLLGIIIVTMTISVPGAIFTEAFLSFIGMGVVPPTPSWGSMCQEGVKTMLSTPHELLFPAALISLTVLAFNLLGDGLRDAFDMRMRGKE